MMRGLREEGAIPLRSAPPSSRDAPMGRRVVAA